MLIAFGIGIILIGIAFITAAWVFEPIDEDDDNEFNHDDYSPFQENIDAREEWR